MVLVLVRVLVRVQAWGRMQGVSHQEEADRAAGDQRPQPAVAEAVRSVPRGQAQA